MPLCLSSRSWCLLVCFGRCLWRAGKRRRILDNSCVGFSKSFCASFYVCSCAFVYCSLASQSLLVMRSYSHGFYTRRPSSCLNTILSHTYNDRTGQLGLAKCHVWDTSSSFGKEGKSFSAHGMNERSGQDSKCVHSKAFSMESNTIA